jgi:hypothetical protein
MISGLLKRVENLESVYNKTVDVSINITSDNSIQFISPERPSYVAHKTSDLFHRDNSPVRLIMGSIRSGKSSAACAEVVMRACAMPPCIDGVRRCRVGVIRNTYPELKTTTIKTWQNWFRELGIVKPNFNSPITFTHVFNDGNGIIELEVLFIALDNERDISKLLSLELTFAYCNELRELPFNVFMHLTTRVGQYPPRRDCPHEYWTGVFADTNPPEDTDHWIYEKFEKSTIDSYKLFKQPPALIKDEHGYWQINPLAENVQNLGKNYFINATAGADDDFIKVYLLGEYGSGKNNAPVYPNYNDNIHATQNLKVINDLDIIVGWDFGLTPACLIAQFTGGQIRLLKEFTTDRMFVKELANIVIPYLRRTFPTQTIHSVCDPAGLHDNTTDGFYSVRILEEMGLRTNGAETNKIEPRIGAVDTFLTRLSEGRPAFLLDKNECPNLRKGFTSKYCYKKVVTGGESRTRYTPDKSHPYSDIQDCLQYICMFLLGSYEKKQAKLPDWVENPGRFLT